MVLSSNVEVNGFVNQSGGVELMDCQPRWS